MSLPDWSAGNFAAVQSVLDSWADTYGLERSLVYAVVSQESRFNPDALRPEPQINDASYGLTQILFKTAQGLGYTGTPAGLYDPNTNAQFGLQYLANQVNRYDNYELALSAYNGGLRGNTINNPDYVAGVLARLDYFDSLAGGLAPNDSSTTATAGGGFLAVLFLAIGLGLWLQTHRR